MVTHWLYQWIDEFAVRDAEDARRKIRLPGPATRLHEIASSVPLWGESEEPRGRAILAGSTMDFSGTLSCSHSECLSRQVDRLFSNVWHYFDSVVVEGPEAHEYVSGLEGKWPDDAVDIGYHVGENVQFLLDLRAAGVSDFLSFRPKPRMFCANHVQEYAENVGLGYLFDSTFREGLVERLKKEGRIIISSREYGWHYELDHAGLPEPFYGVVRAGRNSGTGRMPKKPTKRQIAERLVSESTSALVYDVLASNHHALPLAIEGPYFQDSVKSESMWMRESRIAFEVPLPVMRGMSARDSCLLRRDLRPHFERFQHALTMAIRDQVSRDPKQEDSKIAKAVSEEFIQPSLADIERELVESRKSLSAKVGSSLAVGTAVTTTGLLGAYS